MKAWRFIPLIVLLVVIGAMIWRLSSPPSTTVESQLVGKPVPDFDLAAAIPAKQGLSSTVLRSAGGPRLVNIFASWCVPCATEAPVLLELERQGIAIDGIAIRDRPEAIAAFLARHGDPFDRIGADDTSEVQIALGSSGVPESFIVDGRGIIRYQHIGPIAPSDIPAILSAYKGAR